MPRHTSPVTLAIRDALAETLAGVPYPAVLSTDAVCEAAAPLLNVEPMFLMGMQRGYRQLRVLEQARLVESVRFDDDRRTWWRWIEGEG